MDAMASVGPIDSGWTSGTSDVPVSGSIFESSLRPSVWCSVGAVSRNRVGQRWSDFAAMGDRFLIWGAGGHGRVVRDVVEACGGTVVGFVSRDGTEGVDGLPVFAEAEFRSDADAVLPFGATALALGIGDNRSRLRAWESKTNRRWPKCVHPSAIVGRSVQIGDATIVMARVVINAGALIGPTVILNSGVIVEHDCSVAEGVHLSPGAVLCGAVRMKTTTLVAIVSYADLLFMTNEVAQKTFRPLEVFSVTALIYFTVIYAASLLVQRVERRLATSGEGMAR
jgi:hypothetical protein